MIAAVHDHLVIADTDTVFATAKPQAALLAAAREHKADVVLIDLSGRSLIDSMQIGMLFGIARDCLQEGMRLALCGAQETVRQSLRWVNAQRVMDIYDDRDTALASSQRR